MCVFTSPRGRVRTLNLAKTLLKRNTYLTGTIRRNSKEILADGKKADIGVGKYFANQIILMCFLENINIWLINKNIK